MTLIPLLLLAGLTTQNSAHDISSNPPRSRYRLFRHGVTSVTSGLGSLGSLSSMEPWATMPLVENHAKRCCAMQRSPTTPQAADVLLSGPTSRITGVMSRNAQSQGPWQLPQYWWYYQTLGCCVTHSQSTTWLLPNTHACTFSKRSFVLLDCCSCCASSFSLTNGSDGQCLCEGTEICHCLQIPIRG